VVYETVVGGTSEFQPIHLFAFLCQAVPVRTGPAQLFAVRSAVRIST